MRASMLSGPWGQLAVNLELEHEGAQYVAKVLREEHERSQDKGALAVAEALEVVVEQINDRLEDKERRM